jgi:hypothetical protein
MKANIHCKDVYNKVFQQQRSKEAIAALSEQRRYSLRGVQYRPGHEREGDRDRDRMKSIQEEGKEREAIEMEHHEQRRRPLPPSSPSTLPPSSSPSPAHSLSSASPYSVPPPLSSSSSSSSSSSVSDASSTYNTVRKRQQQDEIHNLRSQIKQVRILCTFVRIPFCVFMRVCIYSCTYIYIYIFVRAYMLGHTHPQPVTESLSFSLNTIQHNTTHAIT